MDLEMLRKLDPGTFLSHRKNMRKLIKPLTVELIKLEKVDAVGCPKLAILLSACELAAVEPCGVVESSLAEISVIPSLHLNLDLITCCSRGEDIQSDLFVTGIVRWNFRVDHLEGHEWIFWLKDRVDEIKQERATIFAS